MLEILNKIISNILTALYQPFWFSILAAILLMFLWLYAREHGWKEVFLIWIRTFKTSASFRKLFLLFFYMVMILMRTLLNRNMWANPVSDVMGGWTLYNSKGELTAESIENLILTIPFTVLLFWSLKDRVLEKVTIGRTLWAGLKYAFLLSVGIEFLQLFLRLGTFQLADIVYNTLGGGIGGLVYYIGDRICMKMSSTF